MAKIPDFFALNLGQQSIKLAQIKQVNGKFRLVNMYSQPTQDGLLENESEIGSQNLAKEISNIVKINNLETKNCVISVPEVSVFSRLLSLPVVEDSEVNNTIHYALKPLVPVPLENLNISFVDIDRRKTGSSEVVDWYVVAAPKSLIDRMQLVADLAGLNLLAVETEALAIARTISLNYPAIQGNDIMILDIGAESTNLILSRNGVVIFSQNIGVGSNSLTKVIAADFGLDNIQAERYKRSYGLDSSKAEGKILKSVDPLMQIVLSEINRTLIYYKDKIGGNGINALYLTGGGSAMPGISEYMTNKLKIKTEVSNPFINLEIDPKLTEALKSVSPNSFNVSIGLALKGFI